MLILWTFRHTPPFFNKTKRGDFSYVITGALSDNHGEYCLGAFYFDPYRTALSFLHLGALKKKDHLRRSIAEGTVPYTKKIENRTFLIENLVVNIFC